MTGMTQCDQIFLNVGSEALYDELRDSHDRRKPGIANHPVGVMVLAAMHSGVASRAESDQVLL